VTLPNSRLPTNFQLLSYSFTINQKHPGCNNLCYATLDLLQCVHNHKKALRRKLNELSKCFRCRQTIPKRKGKQDFNILPSTWKTFYHWTLLEAMALTLMFHFKVSLKFIHIWCRCQTFSVCRLKAWLYNSSSCFLGISGSHWSYLKYWQFERDSGCSMFLQSIGNVAPCILM